MKQHIGVQMKRVRSKQQGWDLADTDAELQNNDDKRKDRDKKFRE